jgi:hypothetical protein
VSLRTSTSEISPLPAAASECSFSKKMTKRSTVRNFDGFGAERAGRLRFGWKDHWVGLDEYQTAVILTDDQISSSSTLIVRRSSPVSGCHRSIFLIRAIELRWRKPLAEMCGSVVNHLSL